MHDIRCIREHAEEFARGLKRRGMSEADARALVSELLSVDERRRAAIAQFEQAQARRNAASKDIGQAKANKDEARAQALMAEMAQLKDSIPALETAAKEFEAELEKTLAEIPNLPADDVPDGADAEANVERHRFGAKRDYGFATKQHFELGDALGQMDFAAAAKLSGARFVVLRKGLARLERALGQFMLDLHTTEHGYTEVAPPLLVRDEVMFGTAQLPKFKEDQFRADRVIDVEVWQRGPEIKPVIESAGPEDMSHVLGLILEQLQNRETLWLIPTAEVSLTNLVREAITPEDELPLRVTALTPCFRAEAGAAGKDTRGMLRQHQ